MSSYVVHCNEVDHTQLSVIGGKALHLAKLANVKGIPLPEWFCVTTNAFQHTFEQNDRFHELLDQLALLTVEDRAEIGMICKKIRQLIIEEKIPSYIVKEITQYLSQLGDEHHYAVRSSATAEDLPYASFAGQQNTYLAITRRDEILRHISKCWASLFTERAVLYRMQQKFDHRQVFLSVIIQRMISATASGVLFTADPVTSNRKYISIDASFGLGEAIVSGIVSADNYKVRENEIVAKKIAAKKLAIYSQEKGGTQTKNIAYKQQKQQTLTDQQILQLARIGRQIEQYFGLPQDIEWCLMDNTFYIVQSRPITTLYPIPKANDKKNRVYISVGHQQMMTDPIKPLGLSFWLLTTSAPARKAGGRLFVDVTQHLASPANREAFIHNMGKHDQLLKDALLTIIKRDFVEQEIDKDMQSTNNPLVAADIQEEFADDPTIVMELIRHSEASVEKLKQDIQQKSGLDLFDFIRNDIQQLRKILFDPRSSRVIQAAMNASLWLNEKMSEWLGEKNVADTLSLSVANNITSEMGLALMDVADVIRRYPEVIDLLHHATDQTFLDELLKVEGGQESRATLDGFLSKYGMRCTAEIDITTPRWSEKPTTLIPMILSNINNFSPKESQRKFEQGRKKALAKEQELLERLEQLPNGKQKAKETKRMIDLIRNFSGYREYPKYGMINRYFIYKQALLKEAELLVQANVIYKQEDIYYLTFEEFREVVRTKELDYAIIDKRKADYTFFEKLTPPRVITSDGEIITGTYQRENIPAGAIVGLPVSSGVIEGRARVVLNVEDAILEPSDILVTSFTDPSWTPLFLSIKGLVTEVGGLMTHGAVIAREYGLAAVVGVENATKRIKDGQRIRVNGTEGYIELL